MSRAGREYRAFYDSVDRTKVYTTETEPFSHPFCGILKGFIEKWQLRDKKCLEIGSSKGLFQDFIEDYTGVDISAGLSKYYHKKYVVADGAALPFPKESFDAIFSYATHEHIPDIETALEEIVRVLKTGGVCLFAPAWHTRPWFSGGYEVRPFADLKLREKLIKLSIPLRDFFLIRWPKILIRRAFRMLTFVFSDEKPQPLKYRRLRANYQTYWQSDSDACNSLDPFDLILWFRSRNIVCQGNENLLKALFVRVLALELKKLSSPPLSDE